MATDPDQRYERAHEPRNIVVLVGSAVGAVALVAIAFYLVFWPSIDNAPLRPSDSYPTTTAPREPGVYRPLVTATQPAPPPAYGHR